MKRQRFLQRPRSALGNPLLQLLRRTTANPKRLIDGLDWGNTFAVFYDSNDNYIGGVQLIASRNSDGKYYLADSIIVPNNVVRIDIKITGGKTYGNVWKK